MPDTSPDLPAMSPLAVYRQAVEQRGFAPDEAQRRAAEALERCFQALHEAHRHGAIQGVYLWGPVGRGKTWLMDHFYQCLRVPARRQHFHHFMQWVHQRQFELTGTADPLRALARELARDVRVLCFDELFVSDIGDAILLGSLLRIMFEEGVVLVATSNQPPEQLYADGFNRERFLPAIGRSSGTWRWSRWMAARTTACIPAGPSNATGWWRRGRRAVSPNSSRA